jgi:hypothetical protein
MSRLQSPRINVIAARLIVTAALALCPYVIKLSPAGLPCLVLADAHAKGGGNGNGNGGNSGNGGNAGNGNGNSGNSGNGKGNGAKAAKAEKADVQSGTIQVVHADGITEKVEAGRFMMTDKMGRTIINRPARPSDIVRLKGR